MTKKKVILIDNGDGGIKGVYGPFNTRAEAARYASALDFYYGEDYDPQGTPPVYDDVSLFEKDWVVIDVTPVDWEQFAK